MQVADLPGQGQSPKAVQAADLLDSKTQAASQSMKSGRSGGQPPKISAGGCLLDSKGEAFGRSTQQIPFPAHGKGEY